MKTSTSPYSAAYLLEILRNRGFVQDQAELTRTILAQHQKRELPVYLKIILSMGAFIAAFCFIGFLLAAHIIHDNSAKEMFIWSIIFMSAAIAISKIAARHNTIQHRFFISFSLALMIAGKLLFVFSMTKYLNSAWAMAFGWGMVAVVIYPIYSMSIDRFFSSFMFLTSLLLSVVWNKHIGQERVLLLNGVFLLQFVGSALLLTQIQCKQYYIPLAYAFVCALCCSVLFLSINEIFIHLSPKEFRHSIFFIDLLFAGGLIVLLAWLVGGVQKLKTEPLILASIGAVLLGIISAPGVLLAIGLLILGYAQHERRLIILGTLLLPIFLFLYYYNLEVSLLQKAAILLGSGVILLIGRVYLQYKGWDKEKTPCAQK